MSSSGYAGSQLQCRAAAAANDQRRICRIQPSRVALVCGNKIGAARRLRLSQVVNSSLCAPTTIEARAGACVVHQRRPLRRAAGHTRWCCCSVAEQNSCLGCCPELTILDPSERSRREYPQSPWLAKGTDGQSLLQAKSGGGGGRVGECVCGVFGYGMGTLEPFVLYASHRSPFMMHPPLFSDPKSSASRLVWVR